MREFCDKIGENYLVWVGEPDSGFAAGPTSAAFTLADLIIGFRVRHRIVGGEVAIGAPE